METLILFARAPVPGQTKTRLAKERGDACAVRLAAGFLEDTAHLCGQWQRQRAGADQNRRVVFYVDPDDQDPILKEFAVRAGARLELQRGEDLGARLRHAFAAELDRGARSVCAIGSDAPTLPVWLLDHAYRALMWERVVLGPTFDGGYWLVGTQRPAPDLFTAIPWSTPAVLAVTAERLRGLGIEPHLLPFWYDVDEAQDVERLVWHARALRAEHGEETVAATWRALLETGLVRDLAAA